MLKLREAPPGETVDQRAGIPGHPFILSLARKQGMREMGLELGLTLLVLLFPLETIAESLQHNGAIQLPPDYETELAVGVAGRSLLGTTVVPLGDSFPLAGQVWHDLLQDSVLAGLQLPFRWQLALVDDHSVNAWSLPDGDVIVDRKLGTLLGSNRGLWAALLSHEIAHVAQRHWLRRYLFESQLGRHVQNYQDVPAGIDGRWQMAALGEQMDAPAASSKFARELELEADNEGMMLMARTGFHPDFALAIHHLLGANLGETSSFAAIFSTHPRWIARDRKSKGHDSALEEFARRWPVAASSPGGAPPTVVFLGEPKSDSSHTNPLTVSFSLHCVNPGEQLRSMLRIHQQSAKKSSQQEAVEYWQPTTCTERDEKKMLTIILPRNEKFEDKWMGEIVILGPENVVLERSHPFTIHSGNVETQPPIPGAMAFQDSRPNL